MADKCWLIYGLICALGGPRYFSFNGTTWTFNSAEYRKHMKAVSEAGANAVRHLPYGGVWWTADRGYGKKGQLSPFTFVSEASGWNLSSWNETFFDLMRDVIEIENSLGMTTFYALSDNCEYAGAYKQYSPWVSNTHGIHSIYEAAAYPHFQAFIQKCQSEFAGLDVMWPLGNEMHNPAFRNLVSGTTHDHTGGAVFPLIESSALDPNKLTYGADMFPDMAFLGPGNYEEHPPTVQDLVKSDVGAEFGDPAKLNIYKEIHGCGKNDILSSAAEFPYSPYGHRVGQACAWWKTSLIRKIFSDDGTKLKAGERGASLVDKESDGAKPSAQFWHDMALYILSQCAKGGPRQPPVSFEHMPQVDTDAVQVPTWTAISKAYYEFFAEWPQNYTGGTTITTGSLKVTLTPAGAIAAGAHWNVDGGAWKDSAATVTGLSSGTHTVYYQPTTGYTSPTSATVVVAKSETTTATGTYVLSSDTGSLKVTITPAGAVTAGAKWYVDDATERASGATVANLTVGSHAVSFKDVALYTSPSAMNVTIVADTTKELADEAIYVLTAATGGLTVTLLPPGAVTAGAHWNVDNGAWKDSGATVTGLSLGAHTIRYQATTGYTAPASESVTIT
jgi:hypothetical protein